MFKSSQSLIIQSTIVAGIMYVAGCWYLDGQMTINLATLLLLGSWVFGCAFLYGSFYLRDLIEKRTRFLSEDVELELRNKRLEEESRRLAIESQREFEERLEEARRFSANLLQLPSVPDQRLAEELNRTFEEIDNRHSEFMAEINGVTQHHIQSRNARQAQQLIASIQANNDRYINPRVVFDPTTGVEYQVTATQPVAPIQTQDDSKIRNIIRKEKRNEA